MNPDYVFSLIRVTKAYGQNVILKDISLSFFRGARIGVIGHNGSGKTTLLRVLAGVETEFDGERIVADDVTIGYLAQEPSLTPGAIRQNLEEAVAHVHELIDRYNELSVKLGEDLSPDEMQSVLDELGTVQTKIDLTDAWNVDHVVDQAAHALGVPDDREADVARLSGGERRRVALCKLLMAHPDVLLLDEPTNHLDADAVRWLEKHLADYQGTVISITHDRYFLDNVAQWMLEMDSGIAYPFEGNYTTYLEQRAKRIHDADARAKARKKRIDSELEWIRANPRGRQAKSKARVKNFEELYADHKNWMDTNRDPMAILIPITRKLGSKVLTAKGITKSFGDREVLKGVNFDLPPGAVMGVIGPNGTGKTTLLKIIAGQMQPDGGDIEMGPTVDLCYVDQDRADLDPNKNVWEEISGGADEISLGKLKINSRAYVSKFNFRGPEQQQLVGTLSGGQRNRVQLAKMLKVGGNLLLVDEPTNDLDISTIQVLEEALQHYAGSAIVVSHDRYFLDKLCTHILSFDHGGEGRFWEGNYQSYLERIIEEGGADPAGGSGKHRRFS